MPSFEEASSTSAVVVIDVVGVLVGVDVPDVVALVVVVSDVVWVVVGEVVRVVVRLVVTVLVGVVVVGVDVCDVVTVVVGVVVREVVGVVVVVSVVVIVVVALVVCVVVWLVVGVLVGLVDTVVVGLLVRDVVGVVNWQFLKSPSTCLQRHSSMHAHHFYHDHLRRAHATQENAPQYTPRYEWFELKAVRTI